ncbi:YqiA/YcfP family alpha/beta fold hydrolase [Hirschia litorea]|uniref:YqiA/YcfP family alpha/beta fold hydrolase n=1 Tax=Hirschia litorea TaxID=1199156 RepID=A0ABW2IMA1_9PROT
MREIIGGLIERSDSMDQSAHSDGEAGQTLLDASHCRISFFDRGSDKLVITFNSMGQILEDDFGRHFFKSINISQINVACSPKDFFQSLSRDSFLQAVGFVVAQHTDVVIYGTSLGGYAAIYFGSLFKARILAIAPRLPIHSYMEGLRSYHSDIELVHTDLRQMNSTQNDVLVVFDPEDEADSKFVSCFFADKNNTRLIALNGAGHFILKQLQIINMLGPCIEGFVRSGDFGEGAIDISAFTQPRRARAESALKRGDLAVARIEIEYLMKVRTGHDPFMTPWGLIKQYVELCDEIDIELPHILPTEYATLSRRMGQPSTPQKMMEAIIKHNYLTCQYQACLSLAELACVRYPESQIAQAYVEKARIVVGKIGPNQFPD